MKTVPRVAYTNEHLPSQRVPSSLVSIRLWSWVLCGSLHDIMGVLTNFQVLVPKESRIGTLPVLESLPVQTFSCLTFAFFKSYKLEWQIKLFKLQWVPSKCSWNYLCACSIHSIRKCYNSWHTNDPLTTRNSAKHQRCWALNKVY